MSRLRRVNRTCVFAGLAWLMTGGLAVHGAGRDAVQGAMPGAHLARRTKPVTDGGCHWEAGPPPTTQARGSKIPSCRTGATQVSSGIQPAPGRTVWDGMYTKPQADRGRIEYMQACASCHADDLRGKGTAPSLVGEDFAFLWDDRSVGDLFLRTRTLMPSDRPNSLPAQTYSDIVAFILQSNTFPAGEKELGTDLDVLRQTLITAKRPER